MDLIFAPSPEEMYPPGATAWVNVEGVSERATTGPLPAATFAGVTTVVSKLFHIVEPDSPSSDKRTRPKSP